MRLIFGVVLLIGIALAGGAVYMAQTYVGSYQAALEAERNRSGGSVPMVEIYVADKDIPYGVPITKADVKIVKYNRDALPEGAFSEANPLFVEDQPPRIALLEMMRHEPVLASKLSEPGAEPGLTSRLARGQRAFTIEVDVTSGVSGFLRPGDRVDVYWTGRPPEINGSNRNSSEVTRLIESGMQVIAIDQNSGAPKPGEVTIARTVTVAAIPQSVAGLTQAQNTGRLTLSLLGHSDDTVAEVIEVNQRSLLGMEAVQEEAMVEEPRVCTIRTRRGSEVVQLEIPCTN